MSARAIILIYISLKKLKELSSIHIMWKTSLRIEQVYLLAKKKNLENEGGKVHIENGDV